MSNDHSYLYVEDDKHSREIMRMIVENAMTGSTLSVFDDSSAFMDRLKALNSIPQVILLDIHMEPLNGFELLKLIRADSTYKHCKIVALTASVMSEEVERLQHAGFDGAIAKPLNAHTFPKLIDRIAHNEAVWHIV
jgi:CheY-like chemotaxis protein